MPFSGFFDPPILHPNVFPSGTVALSLIDKTKGWKPQITVKEVGLCTNYNYFGDSYYEYFLSNVFQSGFEKLRQAN